MHCELLLWLHDPELYIYIYTRVSISYNNHNGRCKSSLDRYYILARYERRHFGPRIDIGINCSPRVANHYIPSDRHDTVPRFALLRAFKRGSIAICRSILVVRTRFPPPWDIRVGAGVKRNGFNSIICTCGTRAPHNRRLTRVRCFNFYRYLLRVSRW